jgi:hypothetical protein
VQQMPGRDAYVDGLLGLLISPVVPWAQFEPDSMPAHSMASIRATNGRQFEQVRAPYFFCYSEVTPSRCATYHVAARTGRLGHAADSVPAGASTVLPTYESSAYQSVYLLQRPRNELAR